MRKVLGYKNINTTYKHYAGAETQAAYAGHVAPRQRRNGILNNELYRGRITYNRQRFVKDPETGKRIARPNPEGLWIKTEVAHLRIIDDKLWEAAQNP